MKHLHLTLVALLLSFASFAVAPITGVTSLCTGYTTNLTDATTGGTWSSSNTTIATVGSSGVVTGILAGTATISYDVSGVYATTVVTVNTTPAAITGTPDVCLGLTTTLSDASTGGLWTSSNTLVATVGSSTGIVTGIVATTTVISYTVGTGCNAAQTVTVNPLPSPITGITTVCVGQTTNLFDFGGGTWSTSNSTIAIVSLTSGIVTGVSAGTATITYVLPTGCDTTISVTVNPNPPTITGSSFVCIGSTTKLSDAVSGGLWSSENLAVASVGIVSGVVSGLSAGVDTITYTLGTGCYTSATITVNTTPSAITGVTSMCIGNTSALSDVITGGTWTSSNTSIATVGALTGIVTGIIAGTATISYTVGTGCYAKATVTIHSLPAGITGSTGLCVGSTTSLSDATGGGTWSSSNTAIAAVGVSTGIVTGITASTAIISYTVGSCSVTQMVTVSPPPSVLYGPSSVCAGGTITLSDAVTGGMWSSSDITVASVGSTLGDVTGISAGTSTITYSLGSGCMVFTAVTVVPTPSAISGPTVLLTGSTATMSDATPGGAWSSNNTTIATIGSLTGIVTGVSAGTADISYTIDGMCYVTQIVTVNPMPTAIIGLSNTRSINVYPNPTTGILNIQWQNQAQGTASISVTDIIGRKVYASVLNINSSTGQTQINLKDLKNGIYLITIKSDNIYYSGKLVIQQ